MKMTIDLSQEEVHEIVKKHLQEKFDSVISIESNIGTQSVGYYKSERQETYFEGLSCKVEMK